MYQGKLDDEFKKAEKRRKKELKEDKQSYNRIKALNLIYIVIPLNVSQSVCLFVRKKINTHTTE